MLISSICEAQVLASQDFNTVLGWTTSAAGWARRTAGTAPVCANFEGAGMARFNSFDLALGATARLTSPVITFDGESNRVKFKMYRDDGYSADADKIEVFFNTTATAGGTLLGTVNRSIALAPIVESNGWYSYSFNLPAGTTGAGYIYFLGTGAYGNNIFIDSVVVDRIPAVDVELSSIVISPIVLNGSLPITGSLKNNGTTAINSLDLNWQIGSGTIKTQTLTGLNITIGSSYNYNHADQWVTTTGEYSLKVWVSNINGGSVDAELTNDQLIKQVTTASQATTRFPLYEKFSSATCPPCAGFNTNYFGPFYNTGLNKDNFALISYQVNWPGVGDPYYTPEIGTRVQYYGVNAAPTLLIDAKPGTFFNLAALQSNLSSATAKPAYINLSATQSLVGSNISVDVTATPFVTGEYKLYVAVVEKVTTGNTASNGETSFKDVFMKMLPDGSGTILNLVDGVPVSTTLQANLSGLFIEELSDLKVIVFIQKVSNKTIMQSAVASNPLANSTFVSAISKVKLYPNPSTGIVKIETINPVSIVFTDVLGKTVLTANEVSKDTQLNLSGLQKGVYFAKINDGTTSQTQKIILE